MSMTIRSYVGRKVGRPIGMRLFVAYSLITLKLAVVVEYRFPFLEKLCFHSPINSSYLGSKAGLLNEEEYGFGSLSSNLLEV
jgi:hypothetical protein